MGTRNAVAAVAFVHEATACLRQASKFADSAFNIVNSAFNILTEQKSQMQNAELRMRNEIIGSRRSDKKGTRNAAAAVAFVSETAIHAGQSA